MSKIDALRQDVERAVDQLHDLAGDITATIDTLPANASQATVELLNQAGRRAMAIAAALEVEAKNPDPKTTKLLLRAKHYAIAAAIFVLATVAVGGLEEIGSELADEAVAKWRATFVDDAPNDSPRTSESETDTAQPPSATPPKQPAINPSPQETPQSSSLPPERESGDIGKLMGVPVKDLKSVGRVPIAEVGKFLGVPVDPDVDPTAKEGGTPDDRESFAQWLREARLAAGLSQIQLAQLADVTPATISAWEHGRTDPRLGSIQRVRTALEAYVK